jgi:hypothetical protein
MAKPSKCPECGVSLKGRDPYNHAVSHYGENVPDPVKFPQAFERYQILVQGVEE